MMQAADHFQVLGRRKALIQRTRFGDVAEAALDFEWLRDYVVAGY
jgi:hypothetical protein